MIAIKHTRLSKRERSNLIKGLLFISPWIVGFCAFVLYPLIYSLIISFTRYSGIKAPVWLGLENYTRLFSDPITWQSIDNTLFYTVLAVPIGIVVAILLAMAMNSSVREVPVYRAAFYIPSILPIFALSFIFIVLVNPQYGLVNSVMNLFGAPTTNFLGDPTSAKVVIVALAQLGAGNAALIFLAGLNGIPTTLYEAARLDGAGRVKRFFNITLPLLSPVILFNLITGLSQGLQVFTPSYIMTQGGPNNGTLFYMYYMYQNAFSFAEIGYACALSLVLFLFGVALALILYGISKRFVNYEIVG